jgi:16S rRNA (guanine527-N7)-methyltransferase
VTDPLGRIRRISAEILGRDLSGDQLAAIEKYMGLLIEWNRVQRLTGSVDRGWITDNIVLDSLLFATMFPPGVRRLLDIGSGAGVPGVPLKIAFPDLEVVLVESRGKRASFLSTVVRSLGLSGIRVVNARVETLSVEQTGLFDVVTARCSGDVRRLGPIAARFLARSGVAIISGPAERAGAESAGSLIEVHNPVNGRTRRFALIRPGADVPRETGDSE